MATNAGTSRARAPGHVAEGTLREYDPKRAAATGFACQRRLGDDSPEFCNARHAALRGLLSAPGAAKVLALGRSATQGYFTTSRETIPPCQCPSTPQ
jgi:hypothetical protein